MPKYFAGGHNFHANMNTFRRKHAKAIEVIVKIARINCDRRYINKIVHWNPSNKAIGRKH
jgi:Flp pilus assembly CpaF family ATPase